MTSGVHFLDASGPAGMRIFAIGDVHGRFDLLEAMHRQIADNIAADPPGDWRIIHVGDYCDRGPDTRGVLSFLIERQHEEPRVLSLRGNHDQGFLEFLGAGDATELFARFGGAQTAASYGVTADFSPTGAEATKRALLEAMPDEHLRFLANLPLSAEFGDFFFCHAGIRPGVPLDEQEPHDLIWIREEFMNDPRLHPKIIVHGHTPVAVPEIMPNRVDVDTGAFQSGVLTALMIDGKEKKLVTVSGPAG